jgi:hypothetical protein
MTPSPSTTPTIHEAFCARDGSGGVQRGRPSREPRQSRTENGGGDVVVCGPDTFANAREAHAIESAVGPCIPDGPHLDSAGALALPHFQQRTPPPDGHSFYETPIRKAIPKP